MKKQLFFSFVSLFLYLGCILQAQNPNPDWDKVEFPKVIFTEFRSDHFTTNYFELTNTEDTAINLSSFSFTSNHYGSYNVFTPQERWIEKASQSWRANLFIKDYILGPGESMVVANVFDKAVSAANTTTPKTNFNFVPYIDYPLFKIDDANPEIPFMNQPEFLTFDFDSINEVDKNLWILQAGGGRSSLTLWYRYDHLDTLGNSITDSLIVDVVNLWVTPGTLNEGEVASNVAGIEEATAYCTLVRKYNSIPLADWEVSRGVSSEDSEWMVVPNSPGNLVYTSVGNYGNYSISLKAKANTTAEVNDVDKTITVPWEAVRGDSVLVNYLDFGDGMAWEFIKDSIDAGDSAYVRVMDGDLLKVYAFGEELQTETYTFKPQSAPADLAIARSKVAHNDGAWRNQAYFDVTTNIPEMDSIRNIRNQLRIDTLMAYIEIPPMATYELIFIDNNNTRVDLKDGDILRVTSENKEVVKDYYLQVNEYNKSDNTNLASITWPDYDKDDFFEWEYLREDTLPDFQTGVYNYRLLLPEHYTNVPALFATTSDINSQLTIKRATNLRGTAEERTTTFTVKSESDTLESVYSVVFELDLGASVQLTKVHPFISENIGLRRNRDDYVELFNPNNGNEPLDMSHYMLVNTNLSNATDAAITGYSPSSPTHVDNQNFYIPGYKFNYNKGNSDDNNDWDWKDQVVGGVTPDPNIDPYVMPGDVFVIGNWDVNSANQNDMFGVPTTEVADLNMQNNPDFPNVVKMKGVANYKPHQSAYYLYEILNDSILNGTKGIWESAEDYRIIDILSAENSQIGGYTAATHSVMYRKPNIQKGNIYTDERRALHADIDTCEFVYYSRTLSKDQPAYMPGNEMGQFLGYHDMDPITFHMSTVTSNAYSVDLGYEGDLMIKGDMSDITVAEFIANLNKPDTAQSISVERANVLQTDEAIIATGDVVVVISADSANTTKYTIESAPLNNDVSLTSVGNLGIIVDNINLTVSGFSYEKNIADVLAGVTCHELSILNVVDAQNNLVPLLTRSRDTSLLEPIVTTKVFNGLYFEVVAEDGTTAKYELTAEVSGSDAYLTSNFLTVNQENKNISGVSGGYSVATFLNLLTPSGKATLELRDKTGAERTYGAIQLDDYVAVISEDLTKTTKYAINFNGEDNPDTPANIKRQNANSLLKLYPNPTSSVLNIENVKLGSVVQVISLNGSMVYNNLVNKNFCTVDLSSMNNGVYIVRLVEKEGVSVFRVLKK